MFVDLERTLRLLAEGSKSANSIKPDDHPVNGSCDSADMTNSAGTPMPSPNQLLIGHCGQLISSQAEQRVASYDDCMETADGAYSTVNNNVLHDRWSPSKCRPAINKLPFGG
jgi:hypothetical protein